VLLGYMMPTALTPSKRLSEELARNVEPLIRLLRAADARPRHIVFASSVRVYGRASGLVRESDAPAPRTPYAIAKLAAEESIRMLSRAAGSTASILRYATVYGPGERAPRAIPNFVRAALAGQPPVVNGDGSDEHDYVHVCDVANATLLALRARAAGTYNIGTGVGTTTLEVCRLVLRLAGADVAPVFRPTELSHKPVRVVCATDLAASDLGFTARRELREGIGEEIGWFRSEDATGPYAALAIA
jgi:UDP-glucose 4-epimerase